MYYVGFCSSCGEGTIGLRVCASSEHVVALCDECDAMWPTTKISAAPQFPDQPHLPCPECGEPLCDSPARWANGGEVAKHGWAESVVGWGEPLGE